MRKSGDLERLHREQAYRLFIGRQLSRLNQLKRTVPPQGTPTMLTFDTFSQLQSADRRQQGGAV